MRPITVSVVLLLAATAHASQRTAVIGIEACQSIGPAEAELETILASSNLTVGVIAGSYPDSVYLCDADLPAGTTAFDSVSLEYASGSQAQPPWVVAYAGAELVDAAGANYYWTEAIGTCGGTCTQVGPMSPGIETLPITVCETSGGLSWAGTWSDAQKAGLAVYFVVFIPGPAGMFDATPCGAAWDQPGEWEANRVFRLIERYEE